METPYLVDGVDDPIDAGISADGLVLWVDENDLEVLVRSVLVDPVRIEHTKIGSTATDTLLSRSSQRALVLQLVDTLVGGLAYSMGQPTVPRCLDTAVRQEMLETHHRWHPFAKVACGFHGGRERDR
jgi:hypothetical protein